MTTTELELKTNRFTAGMNDRDLAQVEELIEDLRDAQAYDRARRRLAESGGKTVPGEEVEAWLVKKFGPAFARSLA
jgi:hypothetical protein